MSCGGEVVVDVPENSQTDSSASIIRTNTGAQECLIRRLDHNSIDQPVSTIQIEIINPKASFENMPFWRFASIACFQHLYNVGKQNFLSEEFIEIKRTHAWDQTLIDSTASNTTGFPTRRVVLADSLYKVAVVILGNSEDKGFVAARHNIDASLPDFLLHSFDSVRLVDERNFGRPQSWAQGGFTQELLESGDTAISVHVLEKNAVLTGEHNFLFSTKSGKLLWWEAEEYIPGN